MAARLRCSKRPPALGGLASVLDDGVGGGVPVPLVASLKPPLPSCCCNELLDVAMQRCKRPRIAPSTSLRLQKVIAAWVKAFIICADQATGADYMKCLMHTCKSDSEWYVASLQASIVTRCTH